MNYGFCQSSGPFIQDNSAEIYCLQLYHYVVSAFFSLSSLKGFKIIEIGSGRGGGLNYIVKTFSPHTAVGIDYTQSQVDLCNAFYSQSNLKFIQGDAENLPILDYSIDAVINIESSHCYGNYSKFIEEVSRVLKKKAHFFYADFMESHLVQVRENLFSQFDLKIFAKEDITENVLRAMDLENTRKNNAAGEVPKIFRSAFAEFVGVPGSYMYTKMQSRELIYMAYHIVKQ